MNILITGGAGYIGSHAVDLMASEGHSILLLDNLSHGFQECVDTLSARYPDQITFLKVDLRDENILREKLNNYEFNAVMHFAAYCNVSESVESPQEYYENNVKGSINLFNVLKEKNIKNVIFSSTCATYGESNYVPLDEIHPQVPVNPYGGSKLMIEMALKDYSNAYKMNHVIFRYFNVCGCSTDGYIGDSKKPSPHLMQNAIRGALNISDFTFTCPTVDTPDGTPIRDYVDVRDLVSAHKLALDYLINKGTSEIFNLGSGKGYSVKEIVDMVEKITKQSIERKKGKERKGEYAKLYAKIDKATSILSWKPQYSLADSVNSLVNWYSKHPNGWKV